MTNPKHTDTTRRDDLVEWLLDWLTVCSDGEIVVEPICEEIADHIKALQNEVERLREELAAAYVDQSGTVQHASDCATSNAPAMKPGLCDCKENAETFTRSDNV